MFAAGAAWSATGLAAAGRTLAGGVQSDDESVRNVAGIMLVRAGVRSREPLRQALAAAAPAQVPMLLRVLGDLGDSDSERDIEKYKDNADPEIAQAARDALKASGFARTDREKKE